MNRENIFSRNNLDNKRVCIVSLLKASQWLLIANTVSLFRGPGRVFAVTDNTVSYFLPFKALQDQDPATSSASSPLHLFLYTPTARAILLLPEPSQTVFLPLNLLFLLPGSLFPLDLCRMDSLLLFRSQL